VENITGKMNTWNTVYMVYSTCIICRYTRDSPKYGSRDRMYWTGCIGQDKDYYMYCICTVHTISEFKVMGTSLVGMKMSTKQSTVYVHGAGTILDVSYFEYRTYNTWMRYSILFYGKACTSMYRFRGSEIFLFDVYMYSK
jgi:hypothetical protein